MEQCFKRSTRFCFRTDKKERNKRLKSSRTPLFYRQTNPKKYFFSFSFFSFFFWRGRGEKGRREGERFFSFCLCSLSISFSFLSLSLPLLCRKKRKYQHKFIYSENKYDLVWYKKRENWNDSFWRWKEN